MSHGSDRLRRAAFNAWMVSLALHLIQAVIDNDVRGIITLGYRPQGLAARLLDLPHALATFAAVLLSGWLMVQFVNRRADTT